MGNNQQSTTTVKSERFITLCILSSLELPADMQYISGATTACLMRVGNKSLLVHQIEAVERYFEATANVFVLCPDSCVIEANDEMDRWLPKKNRCIKVRGMTHFVDTDYPTYGFDSAFSWLLADMRDAVSDPESGAQLFPNISCSPIIIAPGDSLLTNFGFDLSEVSPGGARALLTKSDSAVLIPLSKPKDIVGIPFVEQMATSGRWTLIESTTSGTKVYDRLPMSSASLQGRHSYYAYTGTCTFKNLDSLDEFLKKGKESPYYSSSAAFFKGLLIRSNVELVPVTSGYYDFGHPDTYQVSKAHNFSSREFNSLTADLENSVVTKISDSDTFRDQADWYLETQNMRNVSFYVPRTVVTNTNVTNTNRKNFVEVTTELIPYPTLAELLHYNLPKYYWNIIAKKCVQILTNMYKVRPLVELNVRDNFLEMYREKTLSRFDAFMKSAPPNTRVDSRLTLDEVKSMLEHYLDTSGVLDSSTCDFTLIHGDLCFSNILFDRQSMSIKMIDPRGTFGRCRLYGDLAYDVAKLRHSFHGGYDYILSRHWGPSSQTSKSLLVEEDSFLTAFDEAVSSRKLPASIFERAKLIEPLLFLSMLPLHADDQQRQQALLTRGVELLSSTLTVKLGGNGTHNE